MTSRTWSPTLRWLVNVTPSTLIDVTRRISCNMGGAVNCGLRLQSVKTISTDLALLGFKLLACAQSATWSSSVSLLAILQAGITIYVSSAYLWILLPGVTVDRSDAQTTNDTGPMADPCMMLAEMYWKAEVDPPKRMQCEWSLKSQPASCKLGLVCPAMPV